MSLTPNNIGHISPESNNGVHGFGSLGDTRPSLNCSSQEESRPLSDLSPASSGYVHQHNLYEASVEQQNLPAESETIVVPYQQAEESQTQPHLDGQRLPPENHITQLNSGQTELPLIFETNGAEQLATQEHWGLEQQQLPTAEDQQKVQDCSGYGQQQHHLSEASEEQLYLPAESETIVVLYQQEEESQPDLDEQRLPPEEHITQVNSGQTELPFIFETNGEEQLATQEHFCLEQQQLTAEDQQQLLGIERETLPQSVSEADTEFELKVPVKKRFYVSVADTELEPVKKKFCEQELELEGVQEEQQELDLEGVQEEQQEFEFEGVQEEQPQFEFEVVQEEQQELELEGVQEEQQELELEGVQEEHQELELEENKEEEQELELVEIQEELNLKEFQEEQQEFEFEVVQEEQQELDLEGVKEVEQELEREEVQEQQELELEEVKKEELRLVEIQEEQQELELEEDKEEEQELELVEIQEEQQEFVPVEVQQEQQELNLEEFQEEQQEIEFEEVQEEQPQFEFEVVQEEQQELELEEVQEQQELELEEVKEEEQEFVLVEVQQEQQKLKFEEFQEEQPELELKGVQEKQRELKLEDVKEEEPSVPLPHVQSKGGVSLEGDREQIFRDFARHPGRERIQLPKRPSRFERITSFVHKALDLIRERCDHLVTAPNLQPDKAESEIAGILSVREKLIYVCSDLINTPNPKAWSLIKDIVAGTERALFLSKQLLNEHRSNGDQEQDDYNDSAEEANPMGLDLLYRIRNILTSWYRSSDTPSDQDAAIADTDAAGERQQSNIRQLPRKRRIPEDEVPLIKYRRVDNSFPRIISNEVAEDYAPTRSMEQRERERERERESAKRLSIFNAPIITQQRIRNHVTGIPVELSDDDEPGLFPPVGAGYKAPSLTTTGLSTNTNRDAASTTSSRPQLLYSDAVRLGQNGFAESRINGHASSSGRSSAHFENSLLRHEGQRAEHENYMALINNLCADRSEFRTTNKTNQPPPLELLKNTSSTSSIWGSIRDTNKSLPSQQQKATPSWLPLRTGSRELADYAKRVDREQDVISPLPPPLIRMNSKKTTTSHASAVSSSGSSSSSTSGSRSSGSSGSSARSDEIQTIDDSSDEQGDSPPIPAMAQVPPRAPAGRANRTEAAGESKSTLISSTVAMHELMQRRFESSAFFKDSFVDDYRKKVERQQRELQHRRELAEVEAAQSCETRRAFEKNLRAKMFEYRLTHKPFLFLEQIIQEEEEQKKPEFIPISEEQLHRYNELPNGAPNQVLVPKFGLLIRRSDIRTLYGSSWLNDEVINFYMNLITERSELNAGKLPSVYAMNTFFIPRLLQNGHLGVKRWTRRVDIFSKDIIPVPVHCNGVHWCMAIIHMRNKTIHYYDSMGKPNQVVLDALENYLREESLDKLKKPFDTSDFKIESVANVPQQTNGSDCGVFSCMFAEYITRGAAITFSQENMEYFRKKMVLEIADGQLWN